MKEAFYVVMGLFMLAWVIPGLALSREILSGWLEDGLDYLERIFKR